MTSTTNKKILRVLAGERIDPPPLWFMRQAGRYLPEYREIRGKAPDFLSFCFDPDLAVEATLQPIRRYETDAAILFSDILVVPYAVGQDVAFKEGEGPVLTPVRDRDAIAALTRGETPDRLAPVMETVRRLRRELPQDVTLIGFAGSPWTVATYMVEGRSSRDFAETKKLAFGEPDTFGSLIDVLVEETSAYLSAQVAAGAEALQLFDSWAGVLSDQAFRDWVIAPTKAIVERLKKNHPAVPIIGFPRGAGASYVSYIEETGVDAVSLDTTVPIDWAARTLQSRVPVQGNLDPILTVAGGDAMLHAADHILDGLKGGPHIFNLGHGFVPETPPEHVAALVAHIRGR